MISKVEYYEMHCDRCGKHFHYHNMPASGNMATLELAARLKSWEIIDGRHYCPDCYDIDKEGESVPKTELQAS